MNWPTTTLGDESRFEWLNGLWKGERPPFTRAVVVRNTNFRNDGRLDLTDVAVLDVETRKLVTRTLQPGDIVLERSGGGPKQPVGRVCYVETIGALPQSFSNFTSVLRVKPGSGLLPKFVHYYLLNLYRSGYTENLQRATTGIRNLDFTAYCSAVVPVPSLEEQGRIVAVLDQAMRAITQVDALIALTREFNQVAMAEFFSRGLHHREQRESQVGLIPSDWDVVMLGDVGRIGNGSTPKRTEPGYWRGGSHPWLTSAKIHERLITEADEYVTGLALKECHLPVVPAGSLLVAITGQGKTLGNVAITTIDTSVSQHLAYCTIEREDMDAQFLRLYLASRYEYLRGLGQAGGSTKGALTCAGLKMVSVPKPPIEEQREIARMLLLIEQKIAHHERRRALLADLSGTLLDDIMIGRRRVVELPVNTIVAVA